MFNTVLLRFLILQLQFSLLLSLVEFKMLLRRFHTFKIPREKYKKFSGNGEAYITSEYCKIFQQRFPEKYNFYVNYTEEYP